MALDQTLDREQEDLAMFVRKTGHLSNLFLMLLLASCTAPDRGQDDVTSSQVLLFGNEISNAYTIYESDQEYLDRFRLDSFYYADNDDYIEESAFLDLYTALVPIGEQSRVLGEVYYINIFSNQEASENIELTLDNVAGFSVSTYDDTGINHYYFKRDGDSYSRVTTLDNKTIELYSLRESTLLHFASFLSAPTTNGIIVLRKQLDSQQLAAAATWSAEKVNTTLIDVIYSDADLNTGVAYLDDSPDGGTSCGGRCRVPTTVRSTCAVRTDGINYYCKPLGNDGSCFGHNAMEFAVKNSLTFAINIPKFREFDDQYLMTTELGRKYSEYIPIFDKQMKLDSDSLATYMNIFPDLYRMMDVLVGQKYGDGEMVVNDALYDKVTDFLDQYSHVDDPAFRAMSLQMRGDLAATKGMNRSEFDAWVRKKAIE